MTYVLFDILMTGDDVFLQSWIHLLLCAVFYLTSRTIRINVPVVYLMGLGLRFDHASTNAPTLGSDFSCAYALLFLLACSVEQRQSSLAAVRE